MPQNICDKTPLSAVFAAHISGEEHLRSTLYLADQTLCDLTSADSAVSSTATQGIHEVILK